MTLNNRIMSEFRTDAYWDMVLEELSLRMKHRNKLFVDKPNGDILSDIRDGSHCGLLTVGYLKL